MHLADFTLVRNHAHHIVWIAAGQVSIEVVERFAHIVRVFLVYAEDDGLAIAVGLYQVIGQVSGDGLGATQE